MSEREPTMNELCARQWSGSGVAHPMKPFTPEALERYGGTRLFRIEGGVYLECLFGWWDSGGEQIWWSLCLGCDPEPPRDHTLPTLGGDFCLREGGCTGRCWYGATPEVQERMREAR